MWQVSIKLAGTYNQHVTLNLRHSSQSLSQEKPAIASFSRLSYHHEMLLDPISDRESTLCFDDLQTQ